ncbi:phosphatase PAP2 family protein [Pedobacter sp.]
MLKTTKLFYGIALLVAFALLALFVTNNPVNNLDISISHFLQQFHNPLLDQIMIFISAFGNVPVAFAALLITALVFWLFNYKREALFVLAISFTGIITFSLKRLFNRPRPTDEYVTLIESYNNHSFPSGHTLSYVVFFGFLILLMRNLIAIPSYLRRMVSIFSYLMFVTGPISRVYLGAHWFTDILGGILIGLLYLLVLNHFYKRL